MQNIRCVVISKSIHTFLLPTTKMFLYTVEGASGIVCSEKSEKMLSEVFWSHRLSHKCRWLPPKWWYFSTSKGLIQNKNSLLKLESDLSNTSVKSTWSCRTNGWVVLSLKWFLDSIGLNRWLQHKHKSSSGTPQVFIFHNDPSDRIVVGESTVGIGNCHNLQE